MQRRHEYQTELRVSSQNTCSDEQNLSNPTIGKDTERRYIGDCLESSQDLELGAEVDPLTFTPLS